MKYYEKVKKTEYIEWPYRINYEKENKVSCDVLVIGGGISGCFAAINAAKRGSKVVIVEKGATCRSGAAGAGIDHWANAYTNPCSKHLPEEVIEIQDKYNSFISSHVSYITMKESYDALLELEQMGVQIRDENELFKGAAFRDSKTKLMFAYDYDSKNVIRIFGHDLKPKLYQELKKLKVKVIDRVMVTSLLNKGGKIGNKIVGATGVNTRTGEFYVFQSKATILATAKPLRLWDFSTELIGSNAAHDDPNCAGDGASMAYKAGAELTMMERSHSSMGGRRFPAYGTGNAHNTWYPCTIVDANDKKIPWQDRDGNILNTVEERFRCAKEQSLFLHGPGGGPYETQGPTLIGDLSNRIRKGEFQLPFYADLPSMPEKERNAIFGLMIGNEGKTRTPILGNLKRAGFDPNKDMLQANVLAPEHAGIYEPWWDVKAPGIGGANIRETSFMNYGGLVVDWTFRTSLEGLFAIGNQVAGAEGAANGAANGRYCGRTVSEYVKFVSLATLNEEQIEKEKTRVYRPIENEKGFGWKEVQLGLCRVMQDYCGDVKSKEVLEMGLWWMNSIRKNEVENLCAMNPHELARALECEVRLSIGEIIMRQSIARTSSSSELGFERLENSEHKQGEDKFITMQQREGKVILGEKPFRYWLLGENLPSYKENYDKNACLKQEIDDEEYK